MNSQKKGVNAIIIDMEKEEREAKKKGKKKQKGVSQRQNSLLGIKWVLFDDVQLQKSWRREKNSAAVSQLQCWGSYSGGTVS